MEVHQETLNMILREMKNIGALATSVDNLTRQVASFVENSTEQSRRINDVEHKSKLTERELEIFRKLTKEDMDKYAARVRTLELADGKKWNKLIWGIVLAVIASIAGIVIPLILHGVGYY